MTDDQKMHTGVRFKIPKEVIFLSATILALIIAMISLVKSCSISQKMSQYQKEIAVLQEIAHIGALRFQVDAPAKGEVITAVPYQEMKGTFAGQFPLNYRLWVLANDGHHYFLMYPPTQYSLTNGGWRQPNIKLETTGKWMLHVCMADKKASTWFEARIKENDLSGFSKLPEGAMTVAYVEVEKR